MRRRRRALLPGPVLLGFGALFDADWGRPCKPSEIPTVTPTTIGGQVLPFPCPHCGAVRPQMADPRARAEHRDPVRGFCICPACQGRYRLDPAGMPLPAPLQVGARCAPCRVTVGGVSWILDMNSEADVLDFLEAG